MTNADQPTMNPTIDDLIRTRARCAELELKLGTETGLLLDMLDSSHQFCRWQRVGQPGPDGGSRVSIFNGSGEVIDRFVAPRIVQRDGYALALKGQPDAKHPPRVIALRLDCEAPAPPAPIGQGSLTIRVDLHGVSGPVDLARTNARWRQENSNGAVRFEVQGVGDLPAVSFFAPQVVRRGDWLLARRDTDGTVVVLSVDTEAKEGDGGDVVTIGVQVDGQTVAIADVPADADELAATERALGQARRHLLGRAVVRADYKAGKYINLVTTAAQADDGGEGKP